MDDEEKSIDRVQMLGFRLSRLSEEQVQARQLIEERWLADLERYMGRYDRKTSAALFASNGSRAFVNITRPKTTAAEARLSDMLFPNDDKNWGISPTPIPDTGSENELTPIYDDFGNVVVDSDNVPINKARLDEQNRDEVANKAKAMSKEIDDQLTESNYQAIARDAIHDACLFGTGILKAPVVVVHDKKKWEQMDNAVFELSIDEQLRPGVERVKVWDFFPEMSASSVNDASFIFERRYITKKQLIDLAKDPAYFKDKIRQIIKSGVRSISSNGASHIAKIRELSGISANLDDNRFELWEYHGEVDNETIKACGYEEHEADVLVNHNFIVTFINDVVIKVVDNPMETNEQPYSVFNYEEDDTNIFGFGVPFLLENSQRIVNAAWRMILDNSAHSLVGQIVANRELVIPADGSWEITSGKLWWLKDPTMPARDAFHIFEIPSHQAELSAIFEMARSMADEETSLPMLMQGEQGDVAETATGMSMKMNAANVVLRRIIKSFDDNVTKPLITRFYDWNMQNSDKEEIKGDFNIDARGSSVLLVKETQTQALISLMGISQQPYYKDLTKHVDLYRKAVQAQHITANDIVMTDEEIKAKESNGSSVSPELQMAQIEQQNKDAERKNKLDIATMEGQVDIQVAKIRSFNESQRTETDMQKTKLAEDNKANLFLAERQFAETDGNGRGL